MSMRKTHLLPKKSHIDQARHSDGIPERILEKKLILEKIRRQPKSMKN